MSPLGKRGMTALERYEWVEAQTDPAKLVYQWLTDLWINEDGSEEPDDDMLEEIGKVMDLVERMR